MPNDSELLELLVSQGIVDDERAAKVRSEAVTKNSSIERVLIDWSIIQPEEITLLSAYRYNLTPISLRHFTPDASLIESISPELLNRHKIVPLAKCGKTLTVAQNYNKLLRRIYKAGCGYFMTTLGPGSDGYHEDHFHFDTSARKGGAYCR